MTLFRGEPKEVIARRLMLRDWPEDAARKMAEFLCDPLKQAPRWYELTGENTPAAQPDAARSSAASTRRIPPHKVERQADLCALTAFAAYELRDHVIMHR